MAVFEFTSPEGKTYEITGPDGATHEQAFQILQQQLGAPTPTMAPVTAPQTPADPRGGLSIDNLVRSAAQGVPILGGAADRFAAGMDALTHPLLGRGSQAGSLGDRYSQNLASEQGQTQAFETQNPIASGAANLAGGVGAVGAAAKTLTGAKLLGLTGKTLPTQIGQGFVSGNAIGALDAAVRGEDPVAGGAISAGIGAAAPVAGRVIGKGITTIGRAISPGTIPAENAAAARVLREAGVDVSAGDVTGSRAIKIAESEIGNAIGSGGKAAAQKERALQQFTAAAANKVPEFSGSKNLLPESLDAGIAKISAKFDDVALRNKEIKLDPKFGTDVERIASDFEGLTGKPAKLINDLMKRMAPKGPDLPLAGSILTPAELRALTAEADSVLPTAISGKSYQSIRSEVGRLSREATTPEVSRALTQFQNALDQSVGRNLASPKDKDLWRAARRSWLNSLILKDALNTSTETAAKGHITPAKLTASIKKFVQDGYTRGKSDFAELARAGNTVMREPASSNTAARVAAHFLPSAGGAVIGGITSGDGSGLQNMALGALAPGLAGRALMSKLGQSYLLNQRAAGLRDLPMLGFGRAGSIVGRGYTN